LSADLVRAATSTSPYHLISACFGGERNNEQEKKYVSGVSLALFSLALTGCPERIASATSKGPGRYYNRE